MDSDLLYYIASALSNIDTALTHEVEDEDVAMALLDARDSLLDTLPPVVAEMITDQHIGL